MLENRGKIKITIKTLHGEITYRRTYLAPVDKQSKIALNNLENNKNGIFPLDQLFGIDRLHFNMSPRFMLEVAKQGIRASSYEEASKIIQEKTCIYVCPVTVEQVTDFVGAIMFQKQCREAEFARIAKFDAKIKRYHENDTAYIMADGAMALFRDKDANPSKGIPGHYGYGECKNAIRFDASDVVECKITRPSDSKDKEPRKIITKKHAIGYIGPLSEFKYHVLALAIRTDYEAYSRRVVICDGNISLLKMMKGLFPGATIILDLFHAKENAGKFANIIRNDPNCTITADLLCNLIDEGNTSELLKILSPYKDRKMPDGCVNFYTYVVNHAEYMNYPLYIDQGFIIGSGAMESAHRYLLQDRLKLAGMR